MIFSSLIPTLKKRITFLAELNTKKITDNTKFEKEKSEEGIMAQRVFVSIDEIINLYKLFTRKFSYILNYIKFTFKKVGIKITKKTIFFIAGFLQWKILETRKKLIRIY